MKIITAKSIAEEKMKNGLTREAKVYAGSGRDGLKSNSVHGVEQFKVGAPQWKNSDGHFKLWNEIKEMQSKLQNAATPASPTDLAAYYAKLFIDIQRQQDDMIDLQPIIAKVITDESIQEVTYLRDYLPYVGKEKVISGTNDRVPLIDQKTANTLTVTQLVKAFGWKDSLKALAFAPINVLQRVTEAAAIISLDGKNNDVIGALVAATYGAKHSVAADSTGTTFDLKLYNTLRKAKKSLGALKHPLYTDRLVSTLAGFNEPVLLCHPNNLWDIQRVISGFTAGGFVQDVSPLPIGNVVAYAGGIQNGEVWGTETLNLPGVAENTAYLLLPEQSIVATKRDTTLETGSGSVLELSTEERAWYRISGVNDELLIGGAATNTGKGCIVKIALPTE